ncbi:MAG: DUF2383 domain-containing protein [Clostridium sp.]|uniref:DUF2383 domain-containing protein n=1 Tax=Clostridium sp. TaxID=1506 RepID=UPI00290F39E0|nr:DUF2383 domain-containing protein [Clostridium sp.]MDU4937810.1 DUF2383 domain-containing protein [Clostridium sp.]
MDNGNAKVIKEMNKFLKGIHMGGSTFKDYMERTESKELKASLVEIIETFKRHEEAITHRIEQLGGDSNDSLGVIGIMSEFFQKVKLLSANSDKEILDNAIEAMKVGIDNANKFIDEHSNLENSLKSDVEGVVKDYDNSLRKLESISL